MRIARAISLFALLAALAAAQVATSRLEGTVQDQSGAVVPNANVTAVNNKTQLRADTVGNAEGFFIFPSLPPGEYTVSVEAAGFRKAVHANVVLGVSETVAERFRLELGSVAESVLVEANAVRVQTSESSISRAITMRDIDTLPQLARTPIALAYYQPGVQINGPSPDFSRVNGTRQGSNNTTLDGIDVNDAVVPRLGLSLTANNTDSVAEFRIVTNGATAEYGRNAGAQVELITRSGSNEFHGNLFDYLRNDKLHANNFFNNSAGVPRSKFIQNQFGGSFGGRLRRDRTFVFGNYQGRRVRQEIVRNRTVPTPEAKAGIYRWANGSFDIGRNDPRGKGIDPQVAAILKLFPNPNNADVGDGFNTAGFRFNNPNNNLEDQLTIRGDHNLWSGHRVFYRHSWQRNSFIDSLNNADARFPGQPQGTQGGTRWGYAAGSSWTLSPSMVNEFRFGHQSASVDFRRPARLPGPMLLSNTWTDPLNPGFAQGRNSPVNEFTDNLTLVRTRHTLKFGANLRFTKQWGYTDAGIYPNVSFGTGFAPVPNAAAPPGLTTVERQRFDSLYNDLLGRIAQVTQTYYSDLEKFQPAGAPRVRNYLFHEYGYFIQDDWKATRTLTLNLGLRYEFNGVPFERDRLQGSLAQAGLLGPATQREDLRVERTNRWYNNDYNNFAPRVGFAWDLRGDGRTAIRANYGIFYDRIIGATTSFVDGNTPGFSQSVPTFPNSAAGADHRVADGIPLPQQPAAPVLVLPPTRSTTIGLFSPNLRTGYVQHFSFTLQRELARNTVLEAGYVGTRGVKLFMDVNLNQPRIFEDFLGAFQQLQAFRQSGAAVPASNTLVRLYGSPSAAISAIGVGSVDQGAAGSAANTVDRNPQAAQRYAAAGVSNFYLRNYPQYDQVVYGNNDGRSYYNSLQLSLRRQAGALRFSVNYTFSRSMDNISVDGNGFTAPIDSFNLRLNRALSDGDRPHVLNWSGIYALPFRFPGRAERILGGWEIGLLGIWESGSTYSFNSGRTTGPAFSYLDYTGERTIGSVSRKGNGVFFLTPEEIARFSFPAAGEYGTSGRNAFRGPRFFNMDVSLVKRFRLSEDHSVALRAEAYNLFNNPNFGQPGTSLVTAATFGKISAQAGTPRIMQLALRYDF